MEHIFSDILNTIVAQPVDTYYKELYKCENVASVSNLMMFRHMNLIIDARRGTSKPIVDVMM